MTTPAEASTERIARTGLVVRLGRMVWSVPSATIVSAALAAAGLSLQLIRSERASVYEAISAETKARTEADQSLGVQLHEVRRDIGALTDTLGRQGVLLTEMRAAIAAVDARVAQVQMILMQGRH